DDLRRTGRLRAPNCRVDLAGVELAALLVHRVAARRLLPLRDSGDAFHVADDEDLHEIEPTISPRLLCTSTARNPSIPSTCASAARSPRNAPSSTLNVQASVPSDTQNSPSAPPFANHPGRARISSVSAEPSPPTSSGRAAIAARTLGGVCRNTSHMRES